MVLNLLIKLFFVSIKITAPLYIKYHKCFAVSAQVLWGADVSYFNFLGYSF